MVNLKEGNHKFYLGDNEENMRAVVTYVDGEEDTIILNHTYVSKELRGQNIGAQLVKRVVDFARENDKKVIPQCWFAKNKKQKQKLIKTKNLK